MLIAKVYVTVLGPEVMSDMHSVSRAMLVLRDGVWDSLIYTGMSWYQSGFRVMQLPHVSVVSLQEQVPF